MSNLLIRQVWKLRELLQIDTLGVSEAKVKMVINRSQMHYLPFMYGAVALFFVGYALLQGLVLQEPGSGLMIIVALVSAVVLLIVGVSLRRRMFNTQLSEWFIAFGAGLVLLSILLRGQQTLDPKQTANLALFLFAIAILFVSPLWYALFSLVTLVALILAMATFPPTTDWPYFGVVILAAMMTGLLAHVLRVRAYRHSVVLQIVERDQKRELQQRTNQLQTAVEVGQQITSILDVASLLPEIASLIQQRYRIHYVAIILPNSSSSGCVTAAQAVAAPGQTPAAPVGLDGLVGWVIKNGRTLLVENVLQDDRFVTGEATPLTQSELILPVRMGDHLLGVIDLQSKHSAAFTGEEIPAYQLLADQIAIAMENARHYQEIKRLNEELERKVQDRTQSLASAYSRLEKLDQTKTDFITIASHELRTPMTIVNFNSQMFLEDEAIQGNTVYKGWAEGVHRGVMRMEAVVENILDVAKIDSRALELFPSPLNMRLLIHQVVQEIKRTMVDRDLTFVVAEMSDMPEVEADAHVMEKLFYQILTNAVKYTPDGGVIRIDGQPYPGDLANEIKAQAVEFIITDTGLGVAPDLQELIFDKFFQTSSITLHSSGKTSFRGGGSGIGLAIARGIVEAHNGRIWVESAGFSAEELPGSAFHIVLPVLQASIALNGERGRAEVQPL